MVRRLTGGLLALVGAACAEPTGVTGPFSATYVLASTNGSALPAVVLEGGGNRYTILADTLHFEPTGWVRRTSVVRWTTTSIPGTDTTYALRLTLPYVIDGRTLTMGYTTPCRPDANCVGNERGSIDSETVTIVGRMLWSGEPRFVFKRSSDPVL